MLDGLLAFLIVVAVLGVIVPLALGYLLFRQVMRSPTVRRIRRWMRPRAGRVVVAPVSVQHHVMGRKWTLLVNDAVAARNRFYSTVGEFAPGPLRDSIAAAAADVDVALSEAQRLAHAGDRTDRAHRDILVALETQRRRRRRSGAGPADVVVSLDAATRAQHESAERLAAATRMTMSQLQLVVARLHELSAHALELATLPSPLQLSATSSIADRLAALREATVEVDMAAGL